MNEKPTHEFKIRLDDSADDHEDAPKPASGQVASARKDQAKKAAQGTPWVSYVPIALVALALLFGYIHIMGKLNTVHTSGTEETQHLSKDTESKFSSLAVKLSNQEAALGSLSESHDGLSASVSALKDELSKANKSLSDLSSSKADKKSVSSSVSKLENQLASLEDT